MGSAALVEHLEKLRHFAAIADAGSFAKAATRAGLSQPTLSRSIQILEEALGATLFVRTSHGVSLTDAGDRLLEFSRRLLSDAVRAERDIRDGETTLAGRLDVGTKEPYAVHVWPAYLRELERRYPELEVALHIARSNAELVERLVKRELSLAMLPSPVVPEEIVTYELFRDRFAFFGAPGGKKSLVYLFRPALCGGNRTIETILRREGAVFSGAREVESFEAARAMAVSGLGHALLPASMAEGDVARGALAEVTRPEIRAVRFGELSVCLCAPARHARSAKVRAIVRALREARKGKARSS